MTKINRVGPFEIKVKREDIARFLGYEKNQIPPRVLTMLEDIEANAPKLLEPAAVYRTMTNDEYFHSHYVCHIGAIVVCLVTIGGKLEEVVNKYKLSGDLSHALILDSYGSAAAEAAAEAVELIIREKIEESGLKCSRRFSPGYGGWNVAEQKWIFAGLQGETLGVRLTEGSMLVPRKSITFAMTIGDQPVDMRDTEVCEYCGMVNCRFKHEDNA
ncbi:MAG: hypothetical protein JSW58_15505 [Candidatus Latescibacterota bacterium]|nr:MAG: hypothetical protein JSW58_15505 [Candidatus Latescibacterota bacterium]